MFKRIDHIGVAVADIEASLALWRDSFQMQVAHREVVEEQGVEAVLLDVGENHVELLAPLGEDTPVGKFLAKKGPGLHHVAYQVGDIDATLSGVEGVRHGADRRAPAGRHPRLACRVPASEGDGGRADRDRRAGRRWAGALMASGARRISVGFQGGQVLALRVSDEQLRALHKALGGAGWHELGTEDGLVRLDLGQIVYVRAESDDQRVGFGA